MLESWELIVPVYESYNRPIVCMPWEHRQERWHTCDRKVRSIVVNESYSVLIGREQTVGVIWLLSRSNHCMTRSILVSGDILQLWKPQKTSKKPSKTRKLGNLKTYPEYMLWRPCRWQWKPTDSETNKNQQNLGKYTSIWRTDYLLVFHTSGKPRNVQKPLETWKYFLLMGKAVQTSTEASKTLLTTGRFHKKVPSKLQAGR